MEDSRLDGYQIHDAKVPILLSLRRIADLKPHEETVPGELARLIAQLEQDQILRHPILADGLTGLVLDGTHRLAALSGLDCQLAPCALLDYQNSKIMVERWFRTIKGTVLDNFANSIGHLSPQPMKAAEAERLLSNRSCYASLEDRQHCYAFPSSTQDPVRMTHSGFKIEKEARTKGLIVNYTDTKSIPESSGFAMSTLRIEKHEITRSAQQSRLFPPKTTRHIIPSRPMGLDIPLMWLNKTDLTLAQTRFLEHLQSRKMTRKPEGSWIGSRRYQEEVFLFE